MNVVCCSLQPCECLFILSKTTKKYFKPNFNIVYLTKKCQTIKRHYMAISRCRNVTQNAYWHESSSTSLPTILLDL